MRVSENRVLRKIFGHMMQKATEGSIKLQNEELHNLSSSSSIIQVTNLRKKRREGHVTHWREKKNAYRVVNVKETDHL